MEKKGYRTFRRWVLVFLNLAAATVLAFGVAKNNQEGYTQEMWKDILKGNSLLYSLQGVKELVGKLEEANTSLTKAESSIDRAIQLLNEDKDTGPSLLSWIPGPLKSFKERAEK